MLRNDPRISRTLGTAAAYKCPGGVSTPRRPTEKQDREGGKYRTLHGETDENPGRRAAGSQAETRRSEPARS